jgi:post-segregation antitoxin (ccd killing protein)
MDATPKVRATVYISPELLNRARNAAFHLAGFPARLTLTKLVEQALASELARLQERFNQGEPFPQRGEDLRGGRPIAA